MKTKNKIKELERYQAWFRQAEDDFKWGKSSRDNGYYAQSCFIAQQVGEKALKALAYFKGHDLVKSHSIRQIADSLDINGKIQQAASKLDLYYISSRYPDALPDSGVPSDRFDKSQADEALKFADAILKKVRKEIRVKVQTRKIK